MFDQYQVSTDRRCGIVSDPNRTGPGDEERQYIARLVGRVVGELAARVELLAAVGVGAREEGALARLETGTDV